MAIWADELSGVNDSTQSVKGKSIHIVTNTIVPIILNIKWITVVLLAFLFVPIDASTAVIHVPIFWPNRTYTEFESDIMPLFDNACKIPTDADDDWIIAVNIAPASIPTRGFENVEIICVNVCESLSPLMLSLISDIPINKMPSPPIM